MTTIKSKADKESVEEAANSLFENERDKAIFIRGAKWQSLQAQPKGYSEEQMLRLAQYVADVYRNPTDRTPAHKLMSEYLQSLPQEQPKQSWDEVFSVLSNDNSRNYILKWLKENFNPPTKK